MALRSQNAMCCVFSSLIIFTAKNETYNVSESSIIVKLAVIDQLDFHVCSKVSVFSITVPAFCTLQKCIHTTVQHDPRSGLDKTWAVAFLQFDRV